MHDTSTTLQPDIRPPAALRGCRLAALPLLLLAGGCASSGPRPTDLAAQLPSAAPREAAALDDSYRTPAVDTAPPRGDHRIGPDDQLEVIVFEAPELNRSARVSSQGDISVPLLGEVRAAGLTPLELQRLIEERLRQRYILDPHVSIRVTEIQSQPISIVGAVNRPGIYQVRGVQTLVGVLALAGGLREDAGDVALVMRGGGTAPSGGEAWGGSAPPGDVVEVGLRALMETGDVQQNVAVHPGDVVKVTPAGVVYVVGEVREPGVFPLTSHGGITVVQAVALGQGLRPTAARDRAVIIRTSPNGERSEIRVDLGRVLAGKALDPPLQPRDIVFIPNSAVRSVALGVIESLARMITLRAVF